MGWLKRKLEGFVRARVVSTAWSRADSWLTVKWPAGWPRARRALFGWKTLTGLLILQGDALVQFFRDASTALGMSPDQAAALAGGVLVALGSIHKVLKAVFAETPGVETLPEVAGPNPVAVPTKIETWKDRFLVAFNRARYVEGLEIPAARDAALKVAGPRPA